MFALDSTFHKKVERLKEYLNNHNLKFIKESFGNDEIMRYYYYHSTYDYEGNIINIHISPFYSDIITLYFIYKDTENNMKIGLEIIDIRDRIDENIIFDKKLDEGFNIFIKSLNLYLEETKKKERIKMKTTFNEILHDLGINTPKQFYKLISKYWSKQDDAIIILNPKTGKVRIRRIYIGSDFIPDDEEVELLRLEKPSEENADWTNMFSEEKWDELCYSIDKKLKQIYKEEQWKTNMI